VKLKVFDIADGTWEREGLALYRRINMRTALGQRDQEIAIVYHRAQSGGWHCLLNFYFNFEIVLDAGPAEKWCVVTLEEGPKHGAHGAFRCDIREGRSVLISDDPEVHKGFFAAFAKQGWLASVRGQADTITQFPVSFDETFMPAIMRLNSDVREATC
jgi:hypothetical protein